MQFNSRIYADLRELPEEVIFNWEKQPGLAFDQTIDWYRLIYEYVLRNVLDARIVLISSIEDGKPVAILPLAVTKEAALHFGIRGLRALTNYYSSAFDLIPLSSDIKDGVYDELCLRITKMEKESRFIEIEPVARSSEFFSAMSNSLVRRGYVLSPYRRFANWYHLRNGQSFDEYLSERESRIRNTFSRKEKKLQKIGYEIEIVRGLDRIDTALNDFNSIYKKSWKGDESHPEFIAALCRDFASKGWLRLGVLTVNEQPVAAQIWFVHDSVASIFKLSYDEEYKSLSAGSILTMGLMRYVMNVDQVEKVDYLTGDDNYKRKYMNSCREMWSLRAYKKYSFAGMFGLYEATKDEIKEFFGTRRLRRADGEQ